MKTSLLHKYRQTKKLAYAIYSSQIRKRRQTFFDHHTVRSYEEAFIDALKAFNRENPGRVHRVLDIGGGNGLYLKRMLDRVPDFKFEYWSIELSPNRKEDTELVLDICEPLDVSELEKFDIVFSHNAFEHFHEPMIAAENMSKLTRDGGIVLNKTVFACYHHNAPQDYFRFTDTAMDYMHTKYGYTTIECGYDLRYRRQMKLGSPDPACAPPIDWLGGFTEKWFVFYIGRKTANSAPSGR